MSEHTKPYVPEAGYVCHECRNVFLAPCLVWDDRARDWACESCAERNGIPWGKPTLADHLKSMEPRWIPVSERLPPFGEEDFWFGMVLRADTEIDANWWEGREFDADARITHWLDFTPPELPGKEVE